MPPGQATTITSVERAVAILQAIATASESLGLSEIARRCDLPKSTTVRLLHTLESLDLVERGGASRYHIGGGLHRLATGAPSPGQLRAVARPLLRLLVEELGEDVSLAVADGRRLLYVDQVTAGQAVQVPDWSGQRMPYHVAAAGYVLLTDLPPETVADVLSEPLEAWTANTLTDPAAVRRRIEDTRRRGLVWVREEWAAGIDGIAAPIHDATGRVAAAINVHGPSYRFPGDRPVEDVERRMLATAERIELALRGPPASG